MSTYEQMRRDIVTEIERAKAAWGAYALKIEYENRDKVDLATLTNPYLMVSILEGTTKSKQMDLGVNPLVADYGTIILAAGVREGSGTASLLQLLQHFRPYLQLRPDLGSVKTEVATLDPKPAHVGGFCYQTMRVPFWSIGQAPAIP